MDGLELDWMRFGRHLTPGQEAEQAPILTEFTRQVRALTQEWAARRGHAIELCARIPSHPDAAAGLGMDGVEWAKQGLVDLLVASPFFSSADFDIPLDLWRERLGSAAERVPVIPAIDNGTSAYPGAPRVDIDLALYYGWAATLRSRGADSFYLFNLVYRPQDKPPYRTILDHGLASDIVQSGPRRHPLAYRDTVPPGFPTGARLPKTTDEPATFTIDIGAKPTSGTVSVVLGFAAPTGGGEPSAPVVAASLNGERALAAADEAKPHAYGGKTARAIRYSFPLAALRAGENTVSTSRADGPVRRIVWVEIAIQPPE
jgi:hypothetical protein